MKAIRIHEHGSADVLKIDDVLELTPEAHHVKIKVHYSALNHMDLWVREGIPGVPPLPLTLGCDAAGEIVAVGSDVKNRKVGERVFVFPMTGVKRGEINLNPHFKIFGEHQNGLHSEFVCVPEENAIPFASSVAFDSAAAFPLVALTAWHMVVTKGQAKAGETALVMGASSGVGSMAVQILKALGVRVIATAGGAEKVTKAVQLGADDVIDHYAESISTRIKELTNKSGVNLVIEHVGARVWTECLRSLAWGGRLVTCGATTGPKVEVDLRHIFIKQQSILGSTMGTPDEMEAVAKFLDDGRVRPVISEVFPFSEVAGAHRYLESNRAFGKVLLKWVK